MEVKLFLPKAIQKIKIKEINLVAFYTVYNNSMITITIK